MLVFVGVRVKCLRLVTATNESHCDLQVAGGCEHLSCSPKEHPTNF